VKNRLWYGLMESAFGGSLESCGRFCLSEFYRNLASVALNMFLHLISCLIAICKDNAAINCVTIQHRKMFIPLKFDWSY
jgi:hypothetical protein